MNTISWTVGHQFQEMQMVRASEILLSLSLPHFSDGDIHGMQRLSEMCNRPSYAAAFTLSTQP